MLCLFGNHDWLTSPTIHTEERVINIHRGCRRCGKREDFDISVTDEQLRRWWFSLSMWMYRNFDPTVGTSSAM